MHRTTCSNSNLTLPGVLACLAGASLLAASAAASPLPTTMSGAAQQESNPFAPKPPKARQLPSILERDDQGSVVWVDGDPARHALTLIGLSQRVSAEVEQILAERDRLLLQAAVANADKIVRALQAQRADNQAQYDEFARAFGASLGPLRGRNTIPNDSQVRETLGRVKRDDLSAVVREYNLARAGEERARMEAEAAARGEELAEFVLRDSTILPRCIARDTVTDAARMLEERLGGGAALISAHDGLAATLESEGYWAAMSELTAAQLAAFVNDRTGVEVRFPSPEGDSALAPLVGTPAFDPPADPGGQG